jgi:hypothetical protein
MPQFYALRYELSDALVESIFVASRADERGRALP